MWPFSSVKQHIRTLAHQLTPYNETPTTGMGEGKVDSINVKISEHDTIKDS